MQPAELVAALHAAGAARCNLEDTEWTCRSLRDTDRKAEWLRAVGERRVREGYPLVINARIDASFIPSSPRGGPQEEFVTEAFDVRTHTSRPASIACTDLLWEMSALRRFMSEVSGRWNITREPTAPRSPTSALGVAPWSWGPSCSGADGSASRKARVTSRLRSSTRLRSDDSPPSPWASEGG